MWEMVRDQKNNALTYRLGQSVYSIGESQCRWTGNITCLQVWESKKARFFLRFGRRNSIAHIYYFHSLVQWQLVTHPGMYRTSSSHTFLDHKYTTRHAIIRASEGSMSTDGRWWHVAVADPLPPLALGTQFALCISSKEALYYSPIRWVFSRNRIKYDSVLSENTVLAPLKSFLPYYVTFENAHSHIARLILTNKRWPGNSCDA